VLTLDGAQLYGLACEKSAKEHRPRLIRKTINTKKKLIQFFLFSAIFFSIQFEAGGYLLSSFQKNVGCQKFAVDNFPDFATLTPQNVLAWGRFDLLQVFFMTIIQIF